MNPALAYLLGVVSAPVIAFAVIMLVIVLEDTRSKDEWDRIHEKNREKTYARRAKI